MGRPSMQKEREAQVLDAFQSVVAIYGVEGATLERVAQASGLKRPLIRHHLGNRDDLVDKLAQRVVEQQIAAVDQLEAALTEYPGTQNLVDTLFSAHGRGDRQLNNAYQALVAAIEHYPMLRAPLLSVMVRFYDFANQVVAQDAQGASKEEVRAVAHGIVDLYLTTDVLAQRLPPEDWAHASYEGARRLAKSLSC